MDKVQKPSNSEWIKVLDAFYVLLKLVEAWICFQDCMLVKLYENVNGYAEVIIQLNFLLFGRGIIVKSSQGCGVDQCVNVTQLLH
jgi:hypothetical protein